MSDCKQNVKFPRLFFCLACNELVHDKYILSEGSSFKIITKDKGAKKAGSTCRKKFLACK